LSEYQFNCGKVNLNERRKIKKGKYLGGGVGTRKEI
jgi:hypothetical protein